MKRPDVALEAIVKKMEELEKKRQMTPSYFEFWSFLVDIRLKLDPKFKIPF